MVRRPHRADASFSSRIPCHSIQQQRLFLSRRALPAHRVRPMEDRRVHIGDSAVGACRTHPPDAATHHHHHSHPASSYGEEELAEDLRRHPCHCRSHDRSPLPLPLHVGGGTLRRRRDGQGRHHRLLLLLRQLLEQLVVRGTSPLPRLNRRCFPSRWCASTLRSPSQRCRTASALCW